MVGIFAMACDTLISYEIIVSKVYWSVIILNVSICV